MTINRFFKVLFSEEGGLYDPSERLIFFADTSEEGIFGINYYNFPENQDLEELQEDGEKLMTYCLGSIPAAGTGAPDRLSWIPIESFRWEDWYKEDLLEDDGTIHNDPPSRQGNTDNALSFVVKIRRAKGDHGLEGIFNTPQKQRCRDCCYLVEGDNGEWMCDGCGKDIRDIPDDECSA